MKIECKVKLTTNLYHFFNYKHTLLQQRIAKEALSIAVKNYFALFVHDLRNGQDTIRELFRMDLNAFLLVEAHVFDFP